MTIQPTYESDPKPQQWAVIESVLRRALYKRKRKPLGAPRQHSLYDLYRAMLSVLVNGIRWRDLSRDLLPGTGFTPTSVAGKRWGVFEQVQHAQMARARRQVRRGQPKQVAVDSQSVPTLQKGDHAGTTVGGKSKGASGIELWIG